MKKIALLVTLVSLLSFSTHAQELSVLKSNPSVVARTEIGNDLLCDYFGYSPDLLPWHHPKSLGRTGLAGISGTMASLFYVVASSPEFSKVERTTFGATSFLSLGIFMTNLYGYVRDIPNSCLNIE